MSENCGEKLQKETDEISFNNILLNSTLLFKNE